MLLRSLKDRDYVTLVFNCQYFYYFLNQEGHAFLTNFLGLTDNVVPLTWMYTLRDSARTIIRNTRLELKTALDPRGLRVDLERGATDPIGLTASRLAEAGEDKAQTQKPSSPKHPPHLPPLLRHLLHRADQYLNPMKSKNITIVGNILCIPHTRSIGMFQMSSALPL
jgi:hypothetical protein